MQIETIITLIVLGVVILGSIASIIVALVRGEVKKFIEQKMIEAEAKVLSGKEKYAYVLRAVKEKYKLVDLFLNIKKFVEHVIDLSKKINAK
jgi:pseudouridine-5'-phosphate glycosidase